MSVRYIGDVAWRQVKVSEWSIDHWGLDSVNITYRGSRETKNAFENTISPWHSFPEYPLMRAAGWTNGEGTPSFPEVIVNYRGFRSGVIPPVKIVDGYTSQSAQGSGIDTVTNRRVTGSFLYRASRTTYVWFEKQTPAPLSKYATVRFPIDPLLNIDAYFIQDEETGRPTNTITFSAFVAVFNSLIRKVIVSDYEREELVPGLLWGCRADVDFKVVN